MAEKLADICLTVSPRPPKSDEGHGLGAVVVVSDLLWENGNVLKYAFVNGTDSQWSKVETTIKEWEKYPNIQFTKDSLENSPIRITFEAGKGNFTEGCGSSLGWMPSPDPTMYLPSVRDNGSATSDERHVILHKFGHVLGLFHEHQSPGRVGALTLKRDPIVALYANFGYSPSDVEFDSLSVMLYYLPANCNEQGIELRQQSELSDYDKAYMVVNYPRKTMPSEASPWTFAYALQFVGMPEEGQTALKAYLEQGDIASIRTTFNTWNKVMYATS